MYMAAKFERRASVVWQGDYKDGRGLISTGSGTLKNAPYSASGRFDDGVGTNPEELIAAGHAACFTMALSYQLGASGHAPDRINTSDTVTIEKEGEGWTVTSITIDTVAYVPGMAQTTFEAAANQAKIGCPVSRMLKVPITLNARLEPRAYSEVKKAG
jgi:osmotically inducible protein OsmC